GARISVSVQEGLLSRIQGALVIAIPATISCDDLLELSSTVLNRLESEETEAVVINLQQLSIAETSLLQALHKMLNMIRMMGVPAALSGMQAGLVTAMVHLDMHTDGFCFAKDVQRAIRQLKRSGQ
ncbi:MAG: STAS domain-containing protein, partial [Mariprofundus sp.]